MNYFGNKDILLFELITNDIEEVKEDLLEADVPVAVKYYERKLWGLKKELQKLDRDNLIAWQDRIVEKHLIENYEKNSNK
jgi:hypothetical protein